jgi:hypothetical protein
MLAVFPTPSPPDQTPTVVSHLRRSLRSPNNFLRPLIRERNLKGYPNLQCGMCEGDRKRRFMRVTIHRLYPGYLSRLIALLSLHNVTPQTASHGDERETATGCEADHHNGCKKLSSATSQARDERSSPTPFLATRMSAPPLPTISALADLAIGRAPKEQTPMVTLTSFQRLLHQDGAP